MTLNTKPAGSASGLSFLESRGDVMPRPHGNTYWLWAGHILAGEHPAQEGDENLPEKLQLFALAGITHFIDLTSPADPVKPYHALAGAVRINHPIADFEVPNPLQMQGILQSIRSALNQGGKVYVHCKAGIGRTGTVAATWLTEQGLDDKQALALLLQKWQAMDKRFEEPHTPETEVQREFVRIWHKAKAAK